MFRCGPFLGNDRHAGKYCSPSFSSIFLFCHVLLGLPPSFFFDPMSSSSANDFDWDFLKLSLSDSSASAATVVAPSSREVSGESRGGGVSSKRFSLLAIDSVSSALVCAGYVGKGGLKRFCTQSVSASGGTCAIGGRHATSKFILDDDTFYVRATKQAAFCHPAYPQALIRDEEDRIRIRSVFKTQPEWKAYFSALEAKQIDSIGLEADALFKPPVVVKLDFDPSLTLKTPAKRLIDGYVERMWEMDLTPHIDVPKLPVGDSVPSSEFWDKAVKEWKQPEAMIDTLKNLHECFISLGETWPTPFRDIERHFSLIGNDLEKIQEAIKGLRTDIGKPIPIFEVDSPDIWCAIDHLATSISEAPSSHPASVDLSHISNSVKNLQDQ